MHRYKVYAEIIEPIAVSKWSEILMEVGWKHGAAVNPGIEFLDTMDSIDYILLGEDKEEVEKRGKSLVKALKKFYFVSDASLQNYNEMS